MSWLEPYQEHVDCAEETSPGCEANKFIELHRFTQKQWLIIQSEACQKLVDGYHKPLI